MLGLSLRMEKKIRVPPPPLGYAHDALTNAYIQCVENKMPVRKAAKLYNIPQLLRETGCPVECI